MNQVYTLDQLKAHWKDYNTVQWWLILKDGKKSVRTKAPDPSQEALTQCQMKKASELVSFPRYLEIISA